MKFLIGILLVSALLISESSAIKCYFCTSVTDSNCVSHGFDASKYEPVECSTSLLSINSCVKTHTKVLNQEMVIRSCGSITAIVPGQNGCETSTNGDNFNENCECKSDLCNGARNAFLNIGLLMSLVVAVIAFSQ